MRLVKIRLADCPFWFLGKTVNLTKNKPVSDFINIDSLSDENKKIINHSASRGEIRIFDPDNNKLKNLDSAILISGEFSVDIEDIKYDESDTIPEVFSMTVEDDAPDEDEVQVPDENDYENAELLLSKNGNTVKKTIKQLPTTEEGLMLLHACLETEKSDRNRAGIISTIEQRIMEF